MSEHHLPKRAVARPRFVTFIAALGILGFVGITGTLVTIALVEPTEASDGPSLVLGIAFAVFRLATAIGLLRLWRSARIVELVNNWINLIVIVIGGLYLSIGTRSLAFLAVTALMAFIPAFVVKYLGTPDVRLLFARRIAELPEEERAAAEARLQHTTGPQWAAMILTTIAVAWLAIKVPTNLNEAIHRSRQKRTMADIRSVATAWEARFTELNRYNAAGAFTMPQEPVSEAEMIRCLAPRYIKSIPARDAWGGPFQFRVEVPFAGSARAETYAIRSYGRDGKPSPIVEGATTDFDCDIVFSNGSFVMYPEGRSVGW